MALAELAEPQRQFAVTRDALLEDLNMPRAVHGLDRPRAAVRGFGRVHAFAECLPVP